MTTDSLAELDQVVWSIQARDPKQVTPDGVGDRTEVMMAQAAAVLGCTYFNCVDDDSYDEADGTYYEWNIRVPQAEHRRVNADGIPVAVAALHQLLHAALPEGLDDWSIQPNADLTVFVFEDTILRETYIDLIGPMEAQLLPMRRDGAELLDPLAKVWGRDDDKFAGTYALCLSADPDITEHASWLVLNAGAIAPGWLKDAPHGKHMTMFGVSEDDPVLLLPRPETAEWMVTVTTSPFPQDRPSAVGTRPPVRRVGAQHRWTGPDPQALARRVASDLTALFSTLRPCP